MSDDGEFDGDDGEFDEEIPFEEDSDVEEEKAEGDSDDEEIEEEESEIIDDDSVVVESVKEKITQLEKFKDPKKLKINPVLQKSNTPRTIIVVADDKKKTDNRLHKTDCSHILSIRSEQIAKYGTNFIDT